MTTTHTLTDGELEVVIRDVADNALGLQPADAPLAELVHDVSRELHKERIRARRLEVATRTLLAAWRADGAGHALRSSPALVAAVDALSAALAREG